MTKHWNDILRYPDSAAIIAPKLSVETLAEIWTSAGRDECPLDNEEVLQSILESGDPAKQILTLNLVGGKIYSDTLEKLLALAEESKANRIALLSNQRFYWYFQLYKEKEGLSSFIFALDPSWRAEDISRKNSQIGTTG